MERRDILGRRRQAAQNRGLRSLFPHLPAGAGSRLIRVAMSNAAWQQLDRLVAAASAPTVPRAYGELLEGWLQSSGAVQLVPAARRPSLDSTTSWPSGRDDWQSWQIEKELALLAAVRGEGVEASVH
jgi:hypothetical protein